MTEQRALTSARVLWSAWVSREYPLKWNGDALSRIHASMLQDYRYRRDKPQFAAVCREIRGQFSLLGKVRKALGV